jgi:hypothetical protein
MKPGRDKLSLRIDDPIDAAFESFADVEDPVALEDELAVAHQRMLLALIADDPRCLDLRAHALSPPPGP